MKPQSQATSGGMGESGPAKRLLDLDPLLGTPSDFPSAREVVIRQTYAVDRFRMVLHDRIAEQLDAVLNRRASRRAIERRAARC